MATANSIRIGPNIGEKIKQLDDRVILVAGINPVDKAKPFILPVGPNGVKVDAVINADPSGESLPVYDAVTVDYYGATNNIHHVYYKTGGVTGTLVATRTLSYAGGGAANNDQFLSSALAIA